MQKRNYPAGISLADERYGALPYRFRGEEECFANIFRFKIGEIGQNFFLGHAIGRHRDKRSDWNSQSPYAGCTRQLVRPYGDTRVLHAGIMPQLSGIRHIRLAVSFRGRLPRLPLARR